APVNELITYENVLFTSGFGWMRTPYMGSPTPEREQLWNDLYDFGTSVIPREEAAKLVNKTVPIPGPSGEYTGDYVVMLAVFHYLHCLNVLRHTLYMNHTWSHDPKDRFSLEHLEHCVDALRQHIMCASDVTPHPWMWNAHDGEVKEVAYIMHTCRNFSAIQDWAKARNVFDLPQGWNKSIHVPDPL
ncbi:hypothetical protein B0J12DRAFT_565822, partial [Macrophomina phaseolina]